MLPPFSEICPKPMLERLGSLKLEYIYNEDQKCQREKRRSIYNDYCQFMYDCQK
jgi:hypothetical protein